MDLYSDLRASALELEFKSTQELITKYELLNKTYHTEINAK